MATTLTNAELSVKINEYIVLNGQPINSENSLLISEINEVDKRIVSVPFASEVTVLNFGAAVAAGTFVASSVRYIRITNKDDTNYVRVRITQDSGETFDVKIDAGKSFMMGNTSESASGGGAAFSAFVNMTSINAQANTAAVDIEYFIASI